MTDTHLSTSEANSRARNGFDEPTPPDAGDSSRVGLTPRECGVAGLVALGFGDREIALALHLSTYYVSDCVRQIVAKLHARSRAGVGIALVRAGLADAVVPPQAPGL